MDGGVRGEGFRRFAGAAAIAVGVGGLLFSIAFVLILRTAPYASQVLFNLSLLLGGLLSTAAFVGLFLVFQRADLGTALWALLLGVGGSLASAAHGGFGIATVVRPPAQALAGDVPSEVDPRGLMTFVVVGLSVIVFSWLFLTTRWFPRPLGFLGVLSGVLFLVIYVGRLLIFDPKNPFLLVVALVEGFAVSPAWFVWVGRELLRAPSDVREPLAR